MPVGTVRRNRMGLEASWRGNPACRGREADREQWYARTLYVVYFDLLIFLPTAVDYTFQ
jgi:hypothetical protein